MTSSGEWEKTHGWPGRGTRCVHQGGQLAVEHGDAFPHPDQAVPARPARAMLRERHIILISDAETCPARNARDRAKQRVLHEHFAKRSTTIQRGRSITLYERIDRPHQRA
ncbi:hypothetical protein GCM10020367_69390 [Streptomyces sannanensis]|uniref:Transposase n=2 Tax=Streptomyces sannanensis TaxID=285536 RepID=A0ABP6SME7_9ACTN